MGRFHDRRFGGGSKTNPVTVALEDDGGQVVRYSFTAVGDNATVQFTDDSGNVGSAISVTAGSTVTGPSSTLSGDGKLAASVTFDSDNFRSGVYLDTDIETVSDREINLEPWAAALGGAAGDLYASDGAGGVQVVDSGTYATVAPLDEVIYRPASLESKSTTSTTSADVDATNLAVSFTAPSSGQVDVTLEAHCDSGTAAVTYLWHLRDGSGEIADTGAVVTRNNNGVRVSYRIRVSGLTAGNIYTWKWGHRMGGSATGRILTGPTYGPARMTVEVA